MATFGFNTLRPSAKILAHAVSAPLAEVLRKLSAQLNEKIWLVGGTALSAYYLGHRRSDDLDLFVADPVSLEMAVMAVKSLVKEGLKLSDVSRTPLYYHANAEYKGHPFTIDIVVDENVHRNGHASKVADGLHVADMDTLFAMKAACLVSRASEKDLFDLADMLGRLKHWDVALLISAGKTIDAGVDAETLLISLKGALLRREACHFLLPGSQITVDQAFQTIMTLRNKLVDLLIIYAREHTNDVLVQSLKASVKDFKK